MSDTIVYDPRGVVEAEAQPVAGRVAALDGMRLAVLDNSKWNAGTLLRRTVQRLADDVRLGQVTHYCKDSFSRPASDDLLAEIARDNDIVLTAIGD